VCVCMCACACACMCMSVCACRFGARTKLTVLTIVVLKVIIMCVFVCV